ncbi:MAG TPA: transcriptional regulator [Sedimentisphaerales bacterium]|nr:transcriptional regulator [Sedimentisphaerales bacterium]
MSKKQVNQIHNSINRVVHEPVRLAILKILTSVKEVDFSFLLTTLGVTKGNLATHINKLETTGLLEVKKEFRGKVPHTSYKITRTGRRQFQKYWENMKALAPE